MIWVPYLDETAKTKLKKLNRLACLSLTPTPRSTPQEALEILYNIPPLDLSLHELGLNTFLRLKETLDNPLGPDQFSHIDYWTNIVNNNEELWQSDDTCNDLNWDRKYEVILDSMKGNSKYLRHLRSKIFAVPFHAV